MTRRPILNLNLGPSAVDPSLWRRDDDRAGYFLSGGYFADIASIADSGALDAVFLADVPGLWLEPRHGFPEAHEPTVLAGDILAATERIGLVLTISTTYSEPEDVARRLATLERLSPGRVSWNAVTTAQRAPLANFGRSEVPARADRYAQADRFIVRASEHFRTILAALGAPGERGPRVYQAGGSAEGIELAARHAEAVFCSTLLKSYAQDYVRRIRAAEHRHGRRPGDVKVLPGLSVFGGSTDADARARLETASRAALPHFMAASGQLLAVDLGRFDPAVPLGEEDIASIVAESEARATIGFRDSFVAALRAHGGRIDRTVAAVGFGHRHVAGSAATVARFIREWVDEGAADGFNLSFPNLPDDLEWFVAEVVPILRPAGDP